MHRARALIIVATVLLFCQIAWARPATLDIYFIDVEGGAATLIVTGGRALLIDTGFPGDRDAGRIAHVALEVAGLKQIDHCIITHWHRDHVGGVPALAKLIPIRNYYDHGLPQTPSPDLQAEYLEAYRQTTWDKSVTLKLGDAIKLNSLHVRVLAASGVVLGERSAAPQIRPCGGTFEAKPEDTTDNANSIAVLLTFGRFRFFDGGDLSWNIENRLACPKSIVSQVDVYQVDHHGMDVSNNPLFVGALAPRVAIINDGPRKGGEARTFATLKNLKDIEGIYQLHRNLRTTDQDNAMSGYIANEEEACQGNFIKLSVDPNGKSYIVSIPAKQISRSYRTR